MINRWLTCNFYFVPLKYVIVVACDVTCVVVKEANVSVILSCDGDRQSRMTQHFVDATGSIWINIMISLIVFSSPLLTPLLPSSPPPLLSSTLLLPSPLTWPPTGLHLQEELLRLHVEEYEVTAGEGHHHVIWVAANQVHWGGTSQFWQKHITDVKFSNSRLVNLYENIWLNLCNVTFM